MTMQNTLNRGVENNKVILCNLDEQEVEFDRQFERWIKREISYPELMKKYPEYDIAMTNKLINWISRMLSHIK